MSQVDALAQRYGCSPQEIMDMDIWLFFLLLEQIEENARREKLKGRFR